MKALLARLHIHNRHDFAAFCRQFLKFGLVGLSNTAITLAAQYGLMYLGVDYRPAYVAAFLAGAVNSFYWNGKYVFRTTEPGAARRFAKLLAANAATLLLGLAFMTLLVEKLSCPEQIAPVLNVALTLPLGFLLARLWVFRTR